MFAMLSVGSSARTSLPEPPTGEDPYTWFPAFDKNDYPPHTESGFWGAQQAIQEAAAPTGLTPVNVANASELTTALTAGNREITLTANISNYTFNGTTLIEDIDLIIPEGITFSGVSIGTAFPALTTVFTRFRMRGETVGVFGGGQAHDINFSLAPGSTDFIVEGLNLTGPGGNNSPLTFSTVGHGDLDRLAIHNNRAHCGGYFYIGTASNLIVVGNSVRTGSDLVDTDEAWGIRHYPRGHTIIAYNDIRSNPSRTNQAYARVRFHPDDDVTDAHAWIAHNTFVERVEGNFLWNNSAAGHSSVDAGDMGTLWYLENHVIGGSSCVFTLGDTTAARVIDNTFESVALASSTNISNGGGDTTVCPDVVKTPNTYTGSVPGSDPAWGAAGDPDGLDWEI
jgi:hypothetical protein